MKLTGFIVSILATFAAVRGSFAAEEPQPILSRAIAVWHMDDAKSALDRGNLKIQGAVKLGVALAGPELAASLAQGGDGKITQLDGGWLDAGQGVGSKFN